MQNHRSCICLASLHCDSECDFSRSVDKRLRNHTVCTYWAFLRCIFSCVCADYQTERMHNHICYICLAFLRCEFANVFSSGLPEWKFFHSVDICVAFLQNACSCDFSGDLCEMLSSCIHCILSICLEYCENGVPWFSVQKVCIPSRQLFDTETCDTFDMFCRTQVKVKVGKFSRSMFLKATKIKRSGRFFPDHPIINIYCDHF